MKWYLLIPLVMIVLITTASFCQEFEEREIREIDEREIDIDIEREIDIDLENAERQMHMRKMEMQMQQEEAEMHFQEQMRELELQTRKMDLENAEMDREFKMHAAKMKFEKGEKERPHFKSKEDLHPLLLICLVVHILTAVWVFQDIRKRGAGSGLWIVIALLTGLLGTLVYAVVRLGEKQT